MLETKKKKFKGTYNLYILIRGIQLVKGKLNLLAIHFRNK